MQIPEAMEFVAEHKNAMLLAIKSDGRPQSSNIAYVVNDAGQILVSVTEGRAKTKNLRRDPRASLHVNRDDFWAYVVIEADVELTPVAVRPDDETVDQLVEYFVGFKEDTSVPTLLWQHTLLAFAQHYKTELTAAQKESIRDLLRVQAHSKVVLAFSPLSNNALFLRLSTYPFYELCFAGST